MLLQRVDYALLGCISKRLMDLSQGRYNIIYIIFNLIFSQMLAIRSIQGVLMFFCLCFFFSRLCCQLLSWHNIENMFYLNNSWWATLANIM